MYLCARDWGVQPREFWEMTLHEFLLEHEWRRPKDPEHDYAGSLTRGDVEALMEWDE